MSHTRTSSSRLGAWAISIGGGTELIECYCGDVAVEGGSGELAWLVGNGVEIAAERSGSVHPFVVRGVF